jgi:hypothetical protein
MIDVKRMTTALRFNNDIGSNIHLNPEAKENKDFKIITHEAYLLLNQRYGTASLYEKASIPPPNDIVRLSIPIPTIDPDKPDHIVELFQRRFTIRSYPMIKYNKGIKNKHFVYASR